MAKGACLPCRARKVKCVPKSRRCERCTVLGIEECTYGGVKKRGPGGTLRMGEACTPCRRKKRKCDAERPCTTCVKSGGRYGCFYDEFRTPHHVTRLLPHAASAFLFSDEDTPGPSSAGSYSRRSFGRTEEVAEPSETPGLRVGCPARSGPVASISSSANPVKLELPSASHVFQDFRSFVSRETQCDVRSGPRHHPISLPPSTAPRLFVLPSLRLPIIPRPLHTSFSSFAPENFQVTLGNLEMSFRLTTLLHYSKLGIYLTREKQEAVLKGDTSNAVVHSFFVRQACAYGMQFAPGFSYTNSNLRLLATHSQLTWEELSNIQEGNDDDLKVQAMLSVCTCSIIFRWTDLARRYIRKTCRIVNTAGLQFIPTYGQPPEYSEEFRERSTILSQAIYFENYMFLARGGLEPKLTVRIEREFRHELQGTYPVLLEVCPLTMRTQSILLVRDSISVLNARSGGGGFAALGQMWTVNDLISNPVLAHKSSQWSQSCDQLISLLGGYSEMLLRNLQRFIGIGDNIGARIIWSSCITCLAYLTALCELAGRIEPTASAAMNALCDSNLEKLGHLTEDMRLEEYTYLDLLLGFSWRKSMTVFESRIGSIPMEDSLLLRYWKGVVAKAYSTFQEELPDEEPPETSLTFWEQDGRTEGSRYPNLLQASARNDCGI